MTTRTKTWLHGFGAFVIGGVATAVTSWAGMAAAHGAGMDVPVLNLKALGVIILSSGIYNAFAYLKQSPLPPEGPDTVIVTKSDVQQTNISTTPKL